MKGTLLFAAALAISGPTSSVPQVSGDGDGGIRAVDDESFLTGWKNTGLPWTTPVDPARLRVHHAAQVR